MSPDISGVAKVVGGSLLAAGALAAGAVMGAAIERAVVRRTRQDGWPEPIAPGDTSVREFVTADGTVLHVEIDEADPSVLDPITIVFAHGYALSMLSWGFQRQALRGMARLVFFDQRSHGRSGRAAFDSHRVDQLGTDLAELIASVAPSGPLMLIGHSMGGMTVMALAEQQPELFRQRVLGVAFVATSAGGLAGVSLVPGPFGAALNRLAPGVVALLATQKELVERTRRGGSDLALMLTRAYSFGSSSSNEAARFVASMIDATPIDVLAEFLPALQDHDKRGALPLFQGCELLVIVGSDDRLTPVAHSEGIVREVPGAEFVVIPGAGHMVQVEFPELVDALLLELLARVQRDLAHGAVVA